VSLLNVEEQSLKFFVLAVESLRVRQQLIIVKHGRVQLGLALLEGYVELRLKFFELNNE